MSTSIENARSIVEREGVRTTKMAGVYVTDDETNEARIPGFPYIFKAQYDKILVAVDVFKSGYECKTCKGAKELEIRCPCEITTRPGFAYAEPENEVQALKKCKDCGGDYESARKSIPCPDCGGKGALIYLADESKNLPTTGVVVSMGSLVKNPDIQLNSRVLFGPYTGTMIPTRAPGVVFKVMRSEEVLCTIRGGEEMASFDFVSIDKDL